MCKALLEIMEPEINKIVELEVQKKLQTEVDKEVKKESKKSILNAVKSFRDLGISDAQMKEMLVRNYELTPEEAIMYL